MTSDGSVLANLFRQAETSDLGPEARLSEEYYFSRREEDRLRRAAGDPLQEAGDWTRFLGQTAAPVAEEDGGASERAATASLSLLVEALDAPIRLGGGRAAAALKVLARIRTPASLEKICLAGSKVAVAPAAMAALSTFGGDSAQEAALDLVKAHEDSPILPSLLAGLRGLPGQQSLAILSRYAGEEEFRPGVARALEGFGDLHYVPVLEQLLETRVPWTLIQVIETMGRLGGADLVGRLGAIYAKVPNPQVQVACLQALAESRDRQAGAFVMRGLKSAEPLVKAAAVESVVALPIPRKQYRDQVLSLLDSPHPRLAMNAALACVVLDPKRAVKRVQELLGSGSAAHLVQGIHCLSYMEDRAAGGILRAVIAKTAPGAIQVQAVRALGRRASRDPEATGILAGLLGHTHPNVRITAAWFLAGCHPAARVPAAKAVMQALSREPEASVRSVYCEGLGLAGSVAKEALGVLAQETKSVGPSARSAAWALATAFPDSPEASALERVRTVGVRSRANLASWYSGNLGLENLALLIGSTQADEYLDAVEVGRSIAVTAEMVGTGLSRLSPLEASLKTVRTSQTNAASAMLGRARAAPVSTQAALAVQPQLMAAAGGQLLSEKEAEDALAKAPASASDGDQALVEAGYFQPKEEATTANPAVRESSPASARPKPLATVMSSAADLGVGRVGGTSGSAAVTPPPRPKLSGADLETSRAQTRPPASRIPDAGAGNPPQTTPVANVGPGLFGYMVQGFQIILFFGGAIFLGQLLRQIFDP